MIAKRMIHLTLLALSVVVFGCSGDKTAEKTDAGTPRVETPVFNADSAFAFVKTQVEFGPRVPMTPAHEKCANYLIDKLRSYAADSLIIQRGTVKAFNNDNLPYTNILARYDAAVPTSKRVLLLAHWDTRPWADQEETRAHRGEPSLGANDGASGVGVLLEIARLIKNRRPNVNVDILLVDAEDYGTVEGWGNADETWCLGSQQWLASNPYESVSKPSYAILLDMVGGKDAKFHREYFSDYHAQAIVNKVWSRAASAGYGDVFVNKSGTGVIDDHKFLNEAGIKCIDIIENMNPQTRSFNPTWHTHSDNLDNIDPKTLKAAGQVVVDVVYNEEG